MVCFGLHYLVLFHCIQLTSIQPTRIQRTTVQCYNYSTKGLIHYCDNTRQVRRIKRRQGFGSAKYVLASYQVKICRQKCHRQKVQHVALNSSRVEPQDASNWHVN
jgi:hypothetical protein